MNARTRCLFAVSLVCLSALSAASPCGAQYGSPPDLYRGAPGWIDTDVWPEEALVLVDGRALGEADRFDGFPAYLWLEPGEHTVSFQLQGYRTVTRTVNIAPNRGIRFTDRLVPGSGEEPPAERMTRQPPIWEDGAAPPTRQAPDHRESDARAETRPPEQQRSSEAYIVFTVAPPDAGVWLDDRPLGPATDYDGTIGRAIVAPGPHVIEIARPGYVSHRQEREFAPGTVTSIEVTLAAEDAEPTAQ